MLRCAKARYDWSRVLQSYKRLLKAFCKHFVSFCSMDIPQNTRNLIVLHNENGLSCRQISAMVNVPKSSVNNIILRHQSCGSSQATRVARCGRPRILTMRDERALARKSKGSPAATARQLRTKAGIDPNVSLRTIQRSLLHQGVHAIRPKKSPSLGKSKCLTRLRWCRKYSEYDLEQWKKVSNCHNLNKCTAHHFYCILISISCYRSYSQMRLTLM